MQQYPVIRKGQIHTPIHTGYGASVQRFQKRYSRKKESKLQKKYLKLRSRLERLQAKGRSNWRTRRLEKQVQALETVLGMQPFDASITSEAELMTVADQPDTTDPLLIAVAVLGLGVAGFFIVKSMRKKGK